MVTAWVLGSLALLVLACVFRLWNLGLDSLSHDEAWRANWTFETNLVHARRFPPLQYLLMHYLQVFGGREEWLLRLPYALAGILSVIFIWAAACLHLGRAAAVTACAVMLGHPVLVYYSREVSVFSFEACASALILLTALETWRTPTRRALGCFVLIAVLAQGFTFSAGLQIPLWMIILSIRCWKSEERNRPKRRHIIVGCAVVIAAMIGFCVWVAGYPHMGHVGNYFGQVERAWPPSFEPRPFAIWALWAWIRAFQFISGMAHLWEPLNWILGTVMLLAMLVSLTELWHKCPILLVYVPVLLIATFAFGVLSLWPFGNVRTMTFLVPYFALAVGCGLAGFQRLLRWSPAVIVMVLIAAGVPSLRTLKAAVQSPTFQEHVRPVLEYVETQRSAGDALFVYYPVRPAFEFYWRDPTTPVLIQPGDDRGHTKAFEARFADWIGVHKRVWFVFTHNWRNERREWLGHLMNTYQLIDHFESADASAHLFELCSEDNVETRKD